jgi:hypothetical protein
MTSPYATFISSPYSHTPLYLTSIQKRLKKKKKKKKKKKRKRRKREKEEKKKKKKKEKKEKRSLVVKTQVTGTI